MQTYNPNPVKLTTIDTPQDVVDDVVVGTVNPALETLADGVMYLQSGITAGRYELSITDPLSSGDEATISELWSRVGITQLTPTQLVLQPGIYFVSVVATITSSSTGDPTYSGLSARLGGSTDPDKNVIGRGDRFSATAGNQLQTNAHGTLLVQGDPEDRTLTVVANGSDVSSILVSSLSIVGLPL